ncbi:MAG: hypothetical protein HOV80_07015 [Polyangiaceae bacterium]|nr:hypothetical protein [Polyangiaceae bacterium]
MTPPAVEEDPQPQVIRVALSKRASETLSEVRVRRLVELQLGGDVTVAPEPYGPLDEVAVRVFIDLPSPSVAEIQAQAPKRRLAIRRVDVAGLPWDAATRFVAIAASESIRLQLRPLPKRKPRPPTDAEISERLEKTPSLELGGALTGAWLSGSNEGFFGSRLRFSFHQRVLSEHLSISALGSTASTSWFEGSIGASHRTFWLPDVRTHVGAGFAAAAVFPKASGEADPWIRGYAELGVSLRLGGDAWLGVELQPGAALDAPNERVGAFIGAAMSMSYDGPMD